MSKDHTEHAPNHRITEVCRWIVKTIYCSDDAKHATMGIFFKDVMADPGAGPYTDVPPDPSECASSEESGEAPSTIHGGNRQWVLLVVFIASVLVVTAVDARTTHYLENGVRAYLAWTEATAPWSLLLYMGALVVAEMCTLPIAWLNAGAGPLFADVYGYKLGLLLAIVGMTMADVCAGILAVLIGRSLLRPSLQQMIKEDDRFRVLHAVDGLMDTQGVQMTVIVKAAPIPNGILSYALGCTRVRCIPFAVGSVIVAVPYVACTVFASTSALHLNDLRQTFLQSPLHITLSVIVLLGVIAGIVWMGERMKKKYNELLENLDTRGNKAHAGLSISLVNA